MRVHHLSCGTLVPAGGRLGTPALGCHCLLIESNRGLILVDTGFGVQDIERPRPRLSGLLLRLGGVGLDPLDAAVEQVRELGFKPGDVRHIVLTHLDFDHAGGLTDFPGASVHVLVQEAAAARRRRGFLARRRYRPAQWRAVARWQEHRPAEDTWFDLPAVRPIEGVQPEILMVPLPGHAPGHCGVAVRQGRRWLFHAGDAYFARAEMRPKHPHCPPLLAAGQWLMAVDRAARRRTQQQLRALAARAEEVTIFCAHDLGELRALQRAAERQRAAPAGASNTAA